MRTGKAKWLVGPLILIAALALLVFVATPIQLALGLWGVAITEGLLLLLALIFCLALRWPFKEVFRFRAPRVTQILGVVVMLAGGFFAAGASSMLVLYFFPQGLAVAEGLTGLFQTLPLPLAWLVIAVLPAVCEEFLHRGAIQYSFSRWRSKWAVVAVMGLLFGLFHLDPVRFLPTAILGMILSYIMWQTDNLWLPILYHLLNNSISVVSSAALPEGAEATGTAVDGTIILGAYLILAAGALFVLRLGARLLGTRPAIAAAPISGEGQVAGAAPEDVAAETAETIEPAAEAAAAPPQAPPRPRRALGRIVTGVAALVLVAAGVLFIGSSMPTQALTHIEQTIDAKGQVYEEMYAVTIPEDGIYLLYVKLEQPEGSQAATVAFYEDNGTMVWQSTAESLEYSAPVELMRGDYYYSVMGSYPEDATGQLKLTVEVR